VRAVVVTNPGPAENLELAKLPEPTARPGHVVVRVGAAGVNPVDAGNRANPSWAGIEPPYVVGYEFAGWIEEIGDEVIGFNAGDAVWGFAPFVGPAGGHTPNTQSSTPVGLDTARRRLVWPRPQRCR
jgi:NADPH:quinone reductase-like Zn-dependent oxidoreductase